MIDDKVFSVKDTLFSGQCFRMQEHSGYYTVMCGINENVRMLKISQENAEEAIKDPFWYNYFDMQRDYESMKKAFSLVSPIMKCACDYAPGIRILNQDPWEALCSFVVSQNNNIKRICGIIDRMCTAFGKTGESGIHGFPDSNTLASAPEDKLRETGLGFRVPYIINTARAVENGDINFKELNNLDTDSARSVLMKVKGIGPKVADCALLFGMHRLDCFPIDVWIKRAMQQYFDGKGKELFGSNAGVAQQYIFHWIRNNNEV